MGRRPRIEFPGALYHVWTRGNNRQQIFFDDGDRRAFLDSVAKLLPREGTLLLAYCLMDNHIHLLVETAQAPLNRVMRALLTGYARNFNRRYGRTGHLFQGRYKASICEKESYRLELLRYIHLNPVRAGLVDKPEDWRWSSHRAYLGLADASALTMRPILMEFDERPVRARSALAKFVMDGIGMSEEPLMQYADDLRDGAVLGSGEFHGTVGRHGRKPRRRVEDSVKKRRRIEDMIDDLARHRGHTPEEVRGTCRRADLSAVRAEILTKALAEGWSPAAAARAMNRTRSWASQVRARHGGC